MSAESETTGAGSRRGHRPVHLFVGHRRDAEREEQGSYAENETEQKAQWAIENRSAEAGDEGGRRIAHEGRENRQHEHVEDEVGALGPGDVEIMVGQKRGLEIQEQNQRQDAEAQPSHRGEEKCEKRAPVRPGDQLREEIGVQMHPRTMAAEQTRALEFGDPLMQVARLPGEHDMLQ